MPLAAIRVGAYDCAKIAMLLTGLSFRALCVRMCIDAPDDSTLSYETTKSGLRFMDTSVGTEDSAEPGQVVTISFSGELLSRGTRYVGVGVPQQPWIVEKRKETFEIGGGKSSMWEEAVQGMRVGGRRRVLVPPSAILRPKKKGREMVVPDGDTIAFECELCSIETGPLASCVRAGLLGVGSFGPGFAIILLTNLFCYLVYGWSMIDPGVWASQLAPPQPASATEAPASRCSPGRLLDSRAQLDLAVQASSVQAWTEALDVVADPLLDKQALRAALDACRGGGAQPTLRESELVGRVDEMAGLLRDLAARGDAGASNEEAIRAMRLGTTARSAFDSFLELNRIEDPELK